MGSHVAATDGRPPGRALLVIALLVAVPTALVGSLLHGFGGASLAPILGPWAGLGIGHRDCTMATQMPRATWGCVAGGVAVAVWLACARHRFARRLGPFLFAAWLVGWCWLALMSLLNAAS